MGETGENKEKQRETGKTGRNKGKQGVSGEKRKTRENKGKRRKRWKTRRIRGKHRKQREKTRGSVGKTGECTGTQGNFYIYWEHIMESYMIY